MKRLIFILILSIVLVTACNDRGVERLEQYSERYRFDLPVFNSPICAGRICIE